MPYVLARLDKERQRLDRSSLDGIYNAVLAETDNPEFAELVKSRVWLEQKAASVAQQGSMQ